jgi:hypothetical protein
MLSARENYCPDQVTFSGAEPSHPTTTVANLRDPREIWNTISESNNTTRLAQFIKLLDELNAVECETLGNPQNLVKLYGKLNELAKAMDTKGLLTPDSLALYFFIRVCGNQFEHMFESIQEEYRN